MPDQLQTIVQRMIDAGEPEENIGAVVQHFKTQTQTPPAAPELEGSAVSRFGKGVLRSTLGSEHPLDDLVSGASYAAHHPLDTLALPWHKLLGEPEDKTSILHQTVKENPSIQRGDYAGAAGEAAGTLGSLALGMRGAFKTPPAYSGRIPKGVLLTTAESTGAAPMAVERPSHAYVATPTEPPALSALSDVELAQREATSGRLPQSVVDAMQRGKTPPGVLQTRGNLALKPEAPPLSTPNAMAVDAGGRAVGFESGEGASYRAGDLAQRDRRVGNQGPPSGMADRRLLPDDDVRQAYRANPELGRQADAMRARFADLQAQGRAAIDAGGEPPATPPPSATPPAKPKLDAVQTARMLRDQYGAEQGARMLYGPVQKAAVEAPDLQSAANRTALLKNMAAKSTLPDTARSGIDQALAGMSPEDAQAYFAKGNPLAQRYMKFAHRDLFGGEAGATTPDFLLHALGFGTGYPLYRLGKAALPHAGAALQHPGMQQAIRAALLAQLAGSGAGHPAAGVQP